jgi:hypothetical protein
MKTKKGGRPRKGLAEKLRYRIAVKLCTEDYYRIKSVAKTAGISMTEFARKAIIGCKIVPRMTVELMSLIRQLAGMANNLNQLARKANRDGFGSVVNECTNLAARVDNVITLIENDGKNR